MAGGVGGVPPRKLKKGRVTNPCSPPTSGTQNAGESSARVGKGGGIPGGLGDVPPGGELPTLATSPRVGPKTPASPKPTRVGMLCPRGAWGVSPHENLKGASYQPLQPAHEWDPKRWRILSQRGWGRGVEGAQPLPRGFGGCAPKIKKRGRVAHISNPATSGTQNAGKP